VSGANSNGEVLTGGNASASVLRIGDTVRKPWLPSTERTVAYMLALRDRGIDIAEPHGRDDEGRLVLDYVPGDLAMDRGPLDDELLRRIGALVRATHESSVGLPVPDTWEVLIPADRPDLLCHNDLAAWNLIINGDRLVFIDWDGAGPSTRLWDLANAACRPWRTLAHSRTCDWHGPASGGPQGARYERALRNRSTARATSAWTLTVCTASFGNDSPWSAPSNSATSQPRLSAVSRDHSLSPVPPTSSTETPAPTAS